MTDREKSKAASPGQSDWYTKSMERLVDVVQDLSHARDLDSIMAVVRKAARELTGADGATFVLRDGDKCYYAEEDAISPLWKGQRFPMKTCISGWVMLNAQIVVIEDIYKDPRIPAAAYRPTFVKSLAMVPVRKENPVGAIGNYWAKNRVPSDEELKILQALANVTSVAMENVDLYARLQDKVRALEKSNEELERFAWAASHDLKSPLRAVDNLSKWIEEDLGDRLEGGTRKNMNTLRQRVHRMEKLLDDILEFAHLEHKLNPDESEKTDGTTLLNDVFTLIDIPDGFTLEADEKFKKLRLPRLPLQMIFCNLVDNAIKHHDRPAGRIRIGVEEQETQYIFTVSDDGPGIPPEYRKKIFEMFQTLLPRDTREGSGMGLALVKKMIDLHGGTISVEPRPERGSVFRFTWPKALDV